MTMAARQRNEKRKAGGSDELVLIEDRSEYGTTERRRGKFKKDVSPHNPRIPEWSPEGCGSLQAAQQCGRSPEQTQGFLQLSLSNPPPSRQPESWDDEGKYLFTFQIIGIQINAKYEFL